jgi:Zinc knuckle
MNWGKFCSQQRKNDREGGIFDKSNITCYNCERDGHFSNECRAPETGNVFLPNVNEATAARVKGKKKGKNKKDGMEIMLCQVTSQLKNLSTLVPSLLRDDEVFILNSGAT